MNTIIQLPEQAGYDTTAADFYGWGNVDISAGQFVMITCSGSERVYLGQVVAPQINLNRDALRPFDNTTINQLEALAEARFARDVVVKEVFYYRVRLLKDVTGGQPRSIRKRPQIGSMGRAASEEEVIRFIGLPPADEKFRLGSIIDTEISVCIDRRTLLHHSLVAGSTGSGKSNTMGNIISSSVNHGFCTIIYDHKPDYQDLRDPNDEGSQPFFRGMGDVSNWCLGERLNTTELDIAVPASELDPSVLAATICHQPSEYNAAETLETLLWAFAEERRDTGTWSIADFKRWLPKTVALIKENLNIEIDGRTFSGMKNKLDRRARIPTWIDGSLSEQSRKFFGVSSFTLEKLIRPGGIIVIRIDSKSGNGRSYGLFLSYILKQAYALRERNACCPILHVIDEAQDIFNASRSFQNAVGGMLDDNIRKGRSRQIGFAIGVQSADAVPESIRNNLNSQFIHRHNNHTQAREAMMRASPEQIAMTDTFGPGECLAYIFGANAVLHCQMRQSPFKLTKEVY
jgi:hypothetical protein